MTKMKNLKKPSATLGMALAAILSLGSSALAAPAAEKDKDSDKKEEKKLKEADVPKPVLATVTAKYPGAKFKSFDQEGESGAKAVYEVELSQGKTEISVDVSAEGKILAEETVIAVSELPAPVKEGLAASKYKGWKISKAERVIEAEKASEPAYEVIVEKGKGKKFEVVLDKAGKITKEEAKSANDND